MLGIILSFKSWQVSLEAVVQIHLPPNHTGTILIYASCRVCNISSCGHEQIIDDASASLASCRDGQHVSSDFQRDQLTGSLE
jgi:hypothetical protein